LWFAATLTTFAFARIPKEELERIKPVPDDQPIPVIDFFCPPLFRDVQLNPAGTHFAALLNLKGDQSGLFVYDLTTKKTDSLQGSKIYDIYDYHWLNDERLLFSVTKDNLYALGLYVTKVGQMNRYDALERYNVISIVGFPENNPLHAII
jgi:hypothetical protein